MKKLLLITIVSFHLLAQFGQQGNYLIVDKISIEGNKITKEPIILRELEFEAGDTIQKNEIMSLLVSGRNNLQNTLLFNFVYMDFMPEGDHIEVRIRVVERWYIWPVPIFEHAERNFPAWLQDPEFKKLNYGLQLNWNNFRGRREILQFKARFGYKEQYALSYSKPNLDREQKHGLNFFLNSFRQHEVILNTVDNKPVFYRNDNSYLSRTLSPVVSYTYRPGLYLKHSFSVGYSTIFFEEDSLRMEYLGIEENKGMDWFSAAYNLEYDNRDYRIYPLSGYFFRLDLGRRGLGILQDFDYGKSFVSLNGTHHFRIAPRLYAGNAAKLRLTRDEDQPYIFRQALGYSTYLRGFEYYVVDGNSFFISTNELKYNILKKKEVELKWIPWEQFSKVHFAVYSNLFFDLAWVDSNHLSRNGNNLNNKFLWSTGIGFDLLSYYDQVYRLEFTLNSLGDAGIYLHLETPFSRW